MYVIKRLDQGGGYVTPPGSLRSYTRDINKARVFATEDQARRELCPGNEIIVSIGSCLHGADTRRLGRG